MTWRALSVGVVDKSRLFNRMHMRAGDVVLALPVLRRAFQRLFAGAQGARRRNRLPAMWKNWAPRWVRRCSTPTKIYVKPVLALAERIEVKGASHITGGGFYENVPRCLPDWAERAHRKDGRADAAHFRCDSARRGTCPSAICSTPLTWAWACAVIGGQGRRRSTALLRSSKDAYVLGELVEGRRRH